MVIERKNYSLFLAVFVLIIILYSPLFKLNLNRGVFCLKDLSNIDSITGTIKTSPAKGSNGKYYSSTFIIKSVKYKMEKYGCNGEIKIQIPSSLVEAYFPGKLFSKSKSKENGLFETGGIYSFSVHVSKGVFYVSECMEVAWPETVKGRIQYFRAQTRLGFKRLMSSWGKAGGLLVALLCGSREYTDDTISEAFRKAGLSHILALSGMHLSLFSGIAMFVGKKSKRKQLSFIIRIIALILFVWFAGFSPSLLRAFICAMLVLFASVVDEQSPDMLVILCFSFILQIIISPSDLQSLGFILSYSALSGIIIFNRFFKVLYIKLVPNYVAVSLASSTSAQIFTIPISMAKFGTYSPVGIIATCFISPLITLFIYSGLIFILLSLIFPFMSNLGAFFMNLLYNVINYMVLIFSKAPVWRLN